MFWHRLLNRHVWRTADEYKVEGIDINRIKSVRVWGDYDISELLGKLGGYKVIHQECSICGDRRVLRKW